MEKFGSYDRKARMWLKFDFKSGRSGARSIKITQIFSLFMHFQIELEVSYFLLKPGHILRYVNKLPRLHLL